MPKLVLLVRVAVSLALLAGTPSAQAGEGQAEGQAGGQACAARALVVKKLAERFGETLKSIGLHADDAVVEVYSSETTGTWTILVTHTDGTSCLLAAGQRWEQDVQPIDAPGSDA
jgi:hypothetical protein